MIHQQEGRGFDEEVKMIKEDISLESLLKGDDG